MAVRRCAPLDNAFIIDDFAIIIVINNNQHIDADWRELSQSIAGTPRVLLEHPRASQICACFLLNS